MVCGNLNLTTNVNKRIPKPFQHFFSLFSIRYAGMDDGGMVGGYMYNEKIFINELLRNVSQILNGKPAREIFFVPADAHPTFNYTTLVNKGLNLNYALKTAYFMISRKIS